MARAYDRTPVETRPVSFEVGFTRYAEGSVLARSGDTWVLCNASVEDRVPHHCVESGTGWVTAEYAMLPRSTHTRSDRDGRKGPPRGRTLEIQRLIGRSLRGAVDLSKLAGFTVRLDCDVLQADGGTRTTAVSGSYLALALALRGLAREELIPADTLQSQVAAVSVGIVDGHVLVDLDYLEDSRAEVDLNLVVANGDQLIEVQATAEKGSYSTHDLNRMVESGLVAIQGISRIQAACLGAA